MPTRNIVLTGRQDEFVAELIDSGRYKSASEVLRDGLRLLEDDVGRRRAELESIRDGITQGLAEAERGEFAPGSGEEAVARAFRHARDKRGV